METSMRTGAIPARSDTLRILPDSKRWLPPWLFRNQELVISLERARKTKPETLTNIINHIHFTEGCVFVLLRHAGYEESLLLKAFPEPCMGKTLTCHWADDQVSGLELDKLER
jgi:hypothetical protein